MFSISEVIRKNYPDLANKPYIFKPLVFLLRRLLHESEIREYGETYPHLTDIDFVEQTLAYFDVSFSTRDVEKERIPASGRVVIIANHPIGSLDGLALLKLVSEVRPDIKVVANQLLMAFKPLQGMLLPVNNMQGGTERQKIDAIQNHLNNEGAVLIFPAGEVSRLAPQGVRDTKWRGGFLRIAKQANAPILPMFVDAKNSPLFYTASLIYRPLATLLLAQEMFKHRKKHFPIRVGEMIPPSAYTGLKMTPVSQVKLFKRHLYRIGMDRPGIFATQSAIAMPEDRKVLSTAINACELLGETSDGKKIFLYEHQGSSVIMREIGRLREIAFRAVGEGTNLRRDIDKYDNHYYHLILWDEKELDIVGAYRFGDAAKLSAENHETGLYSATLFAYQDAMQPYFAEGLELGRSFVQPKYWGKRSLDYLWFGIGAFINKYPKYRYLFGPVSLSNNYPDEAKQLIIGFYAHYFQHSDKLANARLPFSLQHDEFTERFVGNDIKADFTTLKHTLANMELAIPTLYKQYSEVAEEGGVHFHAFNIDPDFNDCVDGLVMVDIQKLKPKKRNRYLLGDN